MANALNDGQTLDLSSGLVPKDQSNTQTQATASAASAPLDLSAGLTSKSQGPAQTSGVPENYGFTAGNMAGEGGRGTKERGSGVFDMGREDLFSRRAAGSEKSSYLVPKYTHEP